MQEGSVSFSGPTASLLTGLDMSHIRLCPAIAFNQIVGGRYKLHILCVLNRGPHRYGEIGRSLLKGGLGKPITPRILSRELKELEQRGLVDRKAYPVVPRKVEYSLTDRGRALLPILGEIIRWGATGAHEQILGIT
ncbi:winged helix-turn-helix transcriptional regulator [Chelativorans salis]|uniref:Helix-turn-helix transcriptional regulator n=1 Tax=Chelativorans salis TaxID=2978478 RepID=A0ABT2LHS4_9HYPH|nr:helix-turn-helix domain-containing protein [Chelativorans sp. EGI FJ00035]MCT7374120.1 helix-turn-helix transcriptional regulator [Chelativorans sp. EGI FJ00035]